jgi:hypothetical protein
MGAGHSRYVDTMSTYFSGCAGCLRLYLEILDVIRKAWNIRAAVNEDHECIICRKSGASYPYRCSLLSQSVEIIGCYRDEFLRIFT